jgi:prepilin-type N-terminal cleavage/methylation domain-containing protein
VSAVYFSKRHAAGVSRSHTRVTAPHRAAARSVLEHIPELPITRQGMMKIAQKQTMHTRSQAGFSAIELLIGLTIVAILNMLALPIYTDFQHKAQVSSGLRLASPVQQAVAEYHYTHDAFPASNLAANVAAPDELGNRYVRSISIIDKPKPGTIKISYKAMGSMAEGDALLLLPTDYGEDVLWDCTSITIIQSLLPPICR